MLTHPDDLSIKDLAAATNVSVRTIRFYQSQDLLDAPGTRGSSARYGDSHLKRLELIKALQKERLTLEEIGARLESLDDEGVVRELDDLTRHRASAADYARSIRLAGERPARLEGAAQRAVSGTTPRSRGSWERIALSPGVELHVRSPLSHRQTKLVSRLVELADRLINTQEGV
jgi:DNA-binding transcriptional MerR regulator